MRNYVCQNLFSSFQLLKIPTVCCLPSDISGNPTLDATDAIRTVPLGWHLAGKTRDISVGPVHGCARRSESIHDARTLGVNIVCSPLANQRHHRSIFMDVKTFSLSTLYRIVRETTTTGN